jgi:ATP phosphoribosyltransferase regulatory subunit HisZ
VLGLAGALDELLVAAVGPERAPELARAIARRERGAARGAAAAMPAPTPGVAEAIAEIVERGTPSDNRHLGERGAAAHARLESVRQELTRLDPAVEATIDLAEFADFTALSGTAAAADPGARDFRPYYDGLVMRAYLPGRARPVARGRYDALFRRLGAEVAAVGFSLRLDALAERQQPELQP